MENKENEIDWKSIYDNLDKEKIIEDRKLFAKQRFKKYFLSVIGILWLVFIIAVMFGYIEGTPRCHENEWGTDIECWDPR